MGLRGVTPQELRRFVPGPADRGAISYDRLVTADRRPRQSRVGRRGRRASRCPISPRPRAGRDYFSTASAMRVSSVPISASVFTAGGRTIDAVRAGVVEAPDAGPGRPAGRATEMRDGRRVAAGVLRQPIEGRAALRELLRA